MMLLFETGEPFVVGATEYAYRPASDSETAPRILIPVSVGDVPTTAFVDTGGVYLLCPPEVASRLNLRPEDGIPMPRPLTWRKESLDGMLYRVPLTLHATQGNGCTLEVTAFIPNVRPNQEWPDKFPCIMGMQFCLEFMRFAVDPSADTFYFGNLTAD
jgi:hypothetical protein